MKITNKDVRVKLAEHVEKRDGPGAWEVICPNMDGEESKACRGAIHALSKAKNERLEGEKGAINAVKERLGDSYAAFIKRYNKAYREAEESMREVVVPPKPILVEAAKDEEFTPQELKELDALEAALIKDPIVAVLDKYVEMIRPWGAEKVRRSYKMLGVEAQGAIVKLKALKEKRVADMAIERESIHEKIPRSEIDMEAEENSWEIDVEIFYPIAIGIATGKIGPIAEAIGIFGYAFDGRALPEITALTTMMFMEKYEGSASKLLTYYSAVVVVLGKFTGSYMDAEAMAARKRMESILGLEDVAGEMMKTLRDTIIEEGV